MKSYRFRPFIIIIDYYFLKVIIEIFKCKYFFLKSDEHAFNMVLKHTSYSLEKRQRLKKYCNVFSIQCSVIIVYILYEESNNFSPKIQIGPFSDKTF